MGAAGRGKFPRQVSQYCIIMIELPPIPDKEFFSIGEVSKIVQVQPYVLRYWESEFNLLRPARRNSGQRKYVRKDIENAFQIKDLLYTRRFTIAGAKKYLQGDRRLKEENQFNVELKAVSPVDQNALNEIAAELEDLLKLLNQ
jgi:DNA-binding transcriptional MerR regulator